MRPIFYFLIGVISVFISLIYASPRLEKITTQYLPNTNNRINHQPNAYQYHTQPPTVRSQAQGQLLQQQTQHQNQHHTQHHTQQTTTSRKDSSILPLDLRSIKDCKLTDLLLISDIDGNLHGVERNSGALLWTLPIEDPLVKIQTNNTFDDSNGQSNILWFVEPYQDGSLYYFTPKFGLNKLPTSIKDLVLESPFSLSGDDKIYTGTRKTSLYTINIYTGEIMSSFGNSNACPAPNTHYQNANTLNSNIDDTIMIGKTTYELSIYSKLNTNIVWNVTYSQWGPNNIDNDLIMQNQQSLDELYFTPFHDKSLLAINKDLGTPVWISKLPSLAVSVFDVFNNLKDSEYVLLPHPLQVLNDLQIQIDDESFSNNNDLVFINKTANSDEWFAMSFGNYPTLIKSAPISKYQLNLYKLHNNLYVDDETIDYLKNFQLLTSPKEEVESLINGIHKCFPLSSHTSYQPSSRFDVQDEPQSIKQIGDGSESELGFNADDGNNQHHNFGKSELILDNPNKIIDGIKFPDGTPTPGYDLILVDQSNDLLEPTYLIEEVISATPSSNVLNTHGIIRRVFEDLVVLSILFILLMTFGKSSKYVIAIQKLFFDRAVDDEQHFENENENEDEEYETSEELKKDNTIIDVKSYEISNSDSSNEKIVAEQNTTTSKPIKKVTIVEPNDSLEKEGETDETLTKIEILTDDNELLDKVEGEEEEEVTTKKKRKRGSRGGKRGGRHINKNNNNNNNDNESNDTTNNNENTEDETVIAPEEEVIATQSLVKSSSAPIKIPVKKLQIENNLIISDKILGYGSHGTIVYKGTFENRPVAVKRMLLDFYDVANHEVRLLQESDDHPNVIRYFCSQSSHTEKFLYIALELCLCSLEDIIEKPKKSLAQQHLRIPNVNDVLHQLASGLHYLHSLKIVHRDLKPQNILVADAKKTNNRSSSSKAKPINKEDEENNVRLLISDFGLCKKLDSDQSSFRATTQHAASGTSGWRAPELLLNHDISEISPDTISSVGSNTINSSTTSSSTTLTSGKRLTKAIDIFSLGCVFFYILTGGNHPFGDRYLREGNIIKGEFDLTMLTAKCPKDSHEALDLVSSMITANPNRRPNTSKILRHPLFWSTNKKLEFLLKVSDRFEIEIRDPPSPLLLKLEEKAISIHGGDWHSKFDSEFLDNLGKYRKYHTEKLMDLLRAFRNKYHHYNEIPENLQKQMSPLPDGFYQYFNEKFPNLLMQIYFLVEENLSEEHLFKDFY